MQLIAGGPYEGVVTVDAGEDPLMVRVTATWTRNGQARSTVASVDAAAAKDLAEHWASRLAAGDEPLS
ncbi:MAG TPA: hypothetical protein VGG41_20210 [Solirubrobacteraceae bacterium]